MTVTIVGGTALAPEESDALSGPAHPDIVREAGRLPLAGIAFRDAGGTP